ncbi:MAG: coproporphyrinogen dehydrogenase HemZ [Eubacteriaceae bacterium]|nr:coproporphyrinogen dehydrogenase HemZ [Eubacteriaceae bacterium]
MLKILNEETSFNTPQLVEIINLFDAGEYDITVEVVTVDGAKKIRTCVNNKEKTLPLLEDILTKTAKLLIYLTLSELTGKTFPWGAMTGVRPLKKYVQLSEEGYSDGEIYNFFKENYAASDEKISLLGKINKVQKPYHNWDSRSASLYVHIPLCPMKCKYCSFPSRVTGIGSDDCEVYIHALLKELSSVAGYMKDKGIKTENVYIGGGTPSILSSRQMKTLLDRINMYIPSGIEFTVEAGRADTLDEEKLKVMYDGGVSRISLNPQTTNEDTLRGISRNITNDEFFRLYETADRIGFCDINCDLILGLEGETEKDYEKSINDVLSLGPTNITLHTLCVKRAADLTKAEANSPVDIGVYQNIARKVLEDKGYEPYYMYKQKNALNGAENVGYSLPGHECAYNIAMMGYHRSIFSAGASSSTKIIFDGGYKNVFVPKEFSLYVNNIDEIILKKIGKLDEVYDNFVNQ